jgi:NAD-dependent deacetylase
MSKLLFFSGAGLSADSGLSTFRDAGGLWDKYDIDKVCNALILMSNREIDLLLHVCM